LGWLVYTCPPPSPRGDIVVSTRSGDCLVWRYWFRSYYNNLICPSKFSLFTN